MDEFVVCDPCPGHDPVPDPTVSAYAGGDWYDPVLKPYVLRAAYYNLSFRWERQFGWLVSGMVLHVAPAFDGDDVLREVWLSCG